MRYIIHSFYLCFFLSISLSAEVLTIPHHQQTLNASLTLAPHKTLNDGVILMTHGTLGSRQMEIMQTLQMLLAEKGLNSLAINLSYGIDNRPAQLFDCQTIHRHYHTDAIDEIDAWVQWLSTQGVKQIVLLGHSRGANQTAWYATEHDSDRIKAIVLIAPMLWVSEKVASYYQANYTVALTDVLARANHEKELSAVGFLHCHNATVTADSFRAYYADDPRFHTPTLMARLTKPALLITGSADTTTEGIEQEIIPLLETKKLQQLRIEGADHFFRDLYAEDMAEGIAQFLQPLLDKAN
ncbi:alpha/beta hydrolase family protein [Beggiatoa leptomitoformis]|uniref:Alpha/beta fold hydrolase n=1 Tax=Beggiatoa leptomitoformis TaxID=288004 RepID=A0A2N9YIB1_9GAMM|nr:alpha/beta hydrolase [Beggiatoa leptomitoformis]ALG67629.1 alpha/beta fold hydrolase [Beggiatoa leptomitoformis]AUI70139.1 alpha/beta fold hydrolase [Beggiatoa leptomitoformis]